MPISGKCQICMSPMVDEINDRLNKNVPYKDINDFVTQSGGAFLSPSSISRHYKNHFRPDNVQALVWKNGALCFEDGTPVTAVSAISFLEGVISLAASNITKNPHKIGPRDALLAVELLLKIRSGLDKLDEFEDAWTEFIKSGKHKVKRTKKVTLEVSEETQPEQPALPPQTVDGEIVSYDDWPDEEDDDGG